LEATTRSRADGTLTGAWLLQQAKEQARRGAAHSGRRCSFLPRRTLFSARSV